MRASLLATASVLLAVAPATAAPRSPTADYAERIVRILGSGEPDSSLALELGTLGPRALPAFFELLERGSYEVELTDGRVEERSLGSVQRREVLDAIGRMPVDKLREFFEESSEPSGPTATKAIAIELLGARGTTSDFELLFVLVESDVGPRDRHLLALKLERALVKILERDVFGYRRLSMLIGGAPDSAREAIVRAMGATRSPAALEPLASMLGVQQELDSAILAQIARLAARTRLIPTSLVLDRIRPYLVVEDPNLATAAALALGRLDDFEAVPTLIGYLDHPRIGLREQALWSLRRISGLRLRADADRWESWYRRETEWWSDQSAELFDQLRSSNSAIVARAVNEIARRRLFRNDLAQELTRALTHSDPNVVMHSCGALRQLGSPSAVPPLIDCLTFPDQAVQEAAWETLKELTGEDLPLAAEEWRRAFSG